MDAPIDPQVAAFVKSLESGRAAHAIRSRLSQVALKAARKLSASNGSPTTSTSTSSLHDLPPEEPRRGSDSPPADYSLPSTISFSRSGGPYDGSSSSSNGKGKGKERANSSEEGGKKSLYDVLFSPPKGLNGDLGRGVAGLYPEVDMLGYNPEVYDVGPHYNHHSHTYPELNHDLHHGPHLSLYPSSLSGDYSSHQLHSSHHHHSSPRQSRIFSSQHHYQHKISPPRTNNHRSSSHHLSVGSPKHSSPRKTSSSNSKHTSSSSLNTLGVHQRSTSGHRRSASNLSAIADSRSPGGGRSMSHKRSSSVHDSPFDEDPRRQKKARSTSNHHASSPARKLSSSSRNAPVTEVDVNAANLLASMFGSSGVAGPSTSTLSRSDSDISSAPSTLVPVSTQDTLVDTTNIQSQLLPKWGDNMLRANSAGSASSSTSGGLGKESGIVNKKKVAISGVPGREDEKAAELMIFLATSPSPAKPRNNKPRPGLEGKGRVLFAHEEDSPGLEEPLDFMVPSHIPPSSSNNLAALTASKTRGVSASWSEFLPVSSLVTSSGEGAGGREKENVTSTATTTAA